MRAWVRDHPFWVDLAGTVPMFLFLAVASVSLGLETQSGLLLALIVPLVCPLAIRRTHPVLSVVIIYSAGLLVLLFQSWALLPAAITVPIALHSVTLHGPRWAYRTALVGGLVGMTWFTIWTTYTDPNMPGSRSGLISSLFFSYMFFLTIWAIALMRRSRRETMTALVDRAAQLEIERDQQHRLATAAERTRIAREMHDIVAHSLSVIIAQADGGRYVARQDQAAAERVLGTIAETGRDALADMRRLLGVLRPDVGSQAPGSTTSGALRTIPGPPSAISAAPQPAAPAGGERTPQPASGDLDGLIGQVRASGLRISLVRMGTARALPPGMGLAVYRICQESLTNILKHAGPDPSVTVLLRWEPEKVILDVSDDGRGAAADSDGAGHGLLGMGERATMFGGTLTSGPRPGGGFRVHLELPIPALAPQAGPQDQDQYESENRPALGNTL